MSVQTITRIESKIGILGEQSEGSVHWLEQVWRCGKIVRHSIICKMLITCMYVICFSIPDFSGDFMKTWTELGVCQAHRGMAQNLWGLAMRTELGLGGATLT